MNGCLAMNTKRQPTVKTYIETNSCNFNAVKHIVLDTFLCLLLPITVFGHFFSKWKSLPIHVVKKKSKINGLTTLAVGFPKPCPLSVSIFINNGFVWKVTMGFKKKEKYRRKNVSLSFKAFQCFQKNCWKQWKVLQQKQMLVWNGLID